MSKGVTIRFPDNTHMDMKMKTVKEQTTIQDYVVSLVEKDLYDNQEKSNQTDKK